MIKFKRIDDVSISSLEKLGFSDGDFVAVLLGDGRISCGVLQFITEYQTSFDVNLVLDHTYHKTEDSLYSSVGICKVVLE